MRIVACVNMTTGANPVGYFELEDGRKIHEVSLPLLEAHGIITNLDELETLRGEFYRELAYSVQGAEAIATLSEGTMYRVVNGDTIVAGKEFAMEEFEVPEGIKRIGKGGFQGILSIKNLILPSSVEVIEEDAFNGCKNLEEIKFSRGLKTIGHRAFAGTNLKPTHPLIIPNTVESISTKDVFPKSAQVAYISYELNSSCRRALTRCGLTLRNADRLGYR